MPEASGASSVRICPRCARQSLRCCATCRAEAQPAAKAELESSEPGANIRIREQRRELVAAVTGQHACQRIELGKACVLGIVDGHHQSLFLCCGTGSWIGGLSMATGFSHLNAELDDKR